MKKANKWCMVIGACLVLLVAAFGCAKEAPPAAPTTPAPTEEVGTIKIGILGPMKFLSGEDEWKGALLAAEEINAAGGIDVGGKMYKLELIQKDDNCFLSSTDAAAAVETAITVDKINFMIIGGRTEGVLAEQEIAMDHKVICLGISQSHIPNQGIVKDYERYKYYFNNGGCMCTPLYCYFQIAGVLPVIAALKEELGTAEPIKVAYLAEKAVWADIIGDITDKVMPGVGCEVVGHWRPSHMATDVSVELTQIKDAGAQVIFEIFSSEGGNAVTRQWGELKIPAALGGCNVVAMRDTYWEDTNHLCNYESYSDTANPNVVLSEKTQPFFKAFVARWGTSPTWTAFGSYDGILMLTEGMKIAGALDTDSVVAGMEQVNTPTVGGMGAWWPGDHPVQPHSIRWGPDTITGLAVQWQDGKQMPIWPDGNEFPQIMLDLGCPAGWEGVRHEGTVDYQLPPWVVEYWKK